MEKLISMTDFVLEQIKRKVSVISHMICIEEYANFLKQPLTLGMFVPAKLVNGVWVVLEVPKENDFTYTFDQPNGAETFDGDSYNIALKEYQEAKSRVLFEGFEFNQKSKQLNNISKVFLFFNKISCEVYFDGETEYLFLIEDLVQYNLVLTDSAKKQIGI